MFNVIDYVYLQICGLRLILNLVLILSIKESVWKN